MRIRFQIDEIFIISLLLIIFYTYSVGVTDSSNIISTDFSSHCNLRLTCLPLNLEADAIAVVHKELFVVVSLTLARNESMNASSVENQLAKVK